MKTHHYLAFTIGPILQTITRARKTRELWAASYVFSLLMRKLLEELKAFDILLPHTVFDDQGQLASAHLGAGIWPDRCFVRLGDKEPDVETIIDNACKALAKELDTSENLRTYIKVYPLKANWEETSINEGAIVSDDNDLIPIHRLNRLLDNLELATPYQPIEAGNLNHLLSNKKQIRKLYATAKHTASSVFIQLSDASIRLPSLPELALCEIKHHSNTEIADIYSNTVEVPFNKRIFDLRQQEGRSKDLFSDQKKEQIYIDLKKALLKDKDIIAFRHKYIAVVVADGDNLGAAITEISKDDADGEKLKVFSKNLMSFSKEAVKKVADYGGLPIYAGGDDLLFLAPITNQNADFKHVFELCDKLNNDFKDKMGSTTSLSFGVSISYYKHPLGEAVSEAFELEKKAKAFKVCYKDTDKNHAKQALCFQVRKHSGQQYGATFWLGGNSKTHWMNLLDNSGKPIDDVFLTSIMHKFQSLPGLLANAAANKSLKHFQEHHFNEGGKHDAPFLKNAMDLAQAVFDDYGDILDEKTEKTIINDPQFKKRLLQPLDFHHTNILFAALRLKQFLIQPDHD